MARGPDADPNATQLQAVPPPISRSELARLRRGELDAKAVAALLERTTGLGAPPAPPAGALVPNQSGWLIGAGELPRMQGGPESKRARLFTVLCYSAYFAAMEFRHTHLALLVLLAPVAFVARGATFPRSRVKQQLERAEQVASLADVPEGTVVRVSGTIFPQPTVPTLFRGVPAVLFRNRMGSADETRGLDFFLRLDNGDQTKVAVRGSFLLDRPQRTREPPACGPVFPDADGDRRVLRSNMLRSDPLIGRLLGRYESSVGPGDRVEVCGVVRHVRAPELRSPREVPTRPVLAASEDTPLLVRRPVGG